MSKENNALIIFIKNAVLGEVKTRLAEDIGDKAALAAYIEMQKYTRDIAVNIDATRYLCYSKRIEDSDFWPAKKFQKMVQFGENLGQRMKHAFAYTSTFHDKMVIIGSDCLELDASHIERAYKILDKYDLVIGPSEDGGYYLFGMKTFDASYFDQIEWSTEKVLEQTIAKAKKNKATFHFLEQLNDIDHIGDWEAHHNKLHKANGKQEEE